MKKNLLQSEVRSALISRVEKITSQSPRKFGKMNISQMLAHQNEAFQIAYGEIRPPVRGSWFLRQLMRGFILRTDLPTPPEKAKTFEEIDQVLKNSSPDFVTEKEKLLDNIQNFPTKVLHEK